MVHKCEGKENCCQSVRNAEMSGLGQDSTLETDAFQVQDSDPLIYVEFVSIIERLDRLEKNTAALLQRIEKEGHSQMTAEEKERRDRDLWVNKLLLEEETSLKAASTLTNQGQQLMATWTTPFQVRQGLPS